MRFFLSSFIVLILFSQAVFADTQNEQKEDIKKTKHTPSPPRLLNKFLPDLTQVLTLIENNRFSSEKMTIQQKHEILRNVVITLNPFMDLKIVKPFHIAKAKTKSFPVKKIQQNKILCFRIDAFTSDNIKAFMDTTQEILKSKESPNGIIFDLRNCSGFNNKNMYKVSQRAKSLKLTIICLIGKKTSGDAELLAQSVSDFPKGMLIGNPSAGQPFEYKNIVLKSGLTLLVPEIPEFLKKLPEKPIKPAIYSKGKDAPLNAAVDLLSIIKQIE